MSKIVTTEKLETAFEFIRIANERGGYMDFGREHVGIPTSLPCLIQNPKIFTHLPEPPKKEMWQIWRAKRSGAVSAFPAEHPPLSRGWLPVGEPYEYTYPEESE